MPKFLSIPIEVEAYQVPPDGRLTVEIIDWLERCCGRGLRTRQYARSVVISQPHKGDLDASAGDWLVYDRGMLEVFEDPEFHRAFRRAESA